MLTIFVSEDLLINPLIMQCPICGVLVSLGHFNEIIQSGDKIFAHIDGVHNNPKSSHCGIAYTILKRHTEYRNSTRNCDTPQLLVCSSGLVHRVKYVKITESSSKVKSSFDLTGVESKFTLKASKAVKRTTAQEFGGLFKKFLPHLKVSDNNHLVSFKPNTSLEVIDRENVEKNG